MGGSLLRVGHSCGQVLREGRSFAWLGHDIIMISLPVFNGIYECALVMFSSLENALMEA